MISHVGENSNNGSSEFPPLARAVMDSFTEAVFVFDGGGSLLYVNQTGSQFGEDLLQTLPHRAEHLMPALARLGGKLRQIHLGDSKVAEAVFLDVAEERKTTLADREREVILGTLDANGWKLADSAKQLGISRTTLWRRLRAYGLDEKGAKLRN